MKKALILVISGMLTACQTPHEEMGRGSAYPDHSVAAFHCSPGTTTRGGCRHPSMQPYHNRMRDERSHEYEQNQDMGQGQGY